MFKALIGICLVTQFNIEGGSICYLFRDDDQFKSHFACMQNGEAIKNRMVRELVLENGDKAAIIGQAACLKRDDEA
jgi:hypothetical protein